jgi:hypothetical protein
MPIHGLLTGGSRLQEKRKEIITTAFVLVVAFVVMMAALSYNPAKGVEEPTSIMIFGTVTDDRGNKLENASVQAIVTTYVGEEPERYYTNTDASGNYSLTFEPGTEIEVCACVVSDRLPYWSQYNEYYVQKDTSSIRSDFVLYPTTNVTVPIGIAIVSDTIDGSTRTNVSVNLHYLSLLVDVSGLDRSPDRIDLSFGSTTFNISTTGGMSAVLYMNATVIGEIDMTGRITYVNLYQVGDIYAVPFDPAVLSEEWSSETRSAFDMSPGENHGFTAIANGAKCELPSGLDLSFSFPVLGQNVNVIENGITYDITYPGDDADKSSIAVTIEPVTGGVHSYDECTINGCIIFIREISVA